MAKRFDSANLYMYTRRLWRIAMTEASPAGPLAQTPLYTLHRELGADHYAPPAILRQKVAGGELGKKSGKGFYEWPKTSS